MHQRAVDDFIATITLTRIFAGLSREDLARAAGKLDEVSAGAGKAIFRQGDPGDALYIVQAGMPETGGPSRGRRRARSYSFPKLVACIIDTCGARHNPASPGRPTPPTARRPALSFRPAARRAPLRFHLSPWRGPMGPTAWRRSALLRQPHTHERVGRGFGEGQE